MNVRDWFMNLATRERLLVSAAGVLLVLALIVILGVRPLLNGAARAEEKVENKTEILAELDALAARLGRGGGSVTGNDAIDADQSLVVLIDRTTRSSGLAAYVKRNQPDGKESIRVRFEEAPFDELVSWLSTVKNENGLSILSASIDRSPSAGRVNCNLLLTRG